MERFAEISECGRYRWTLRRVWADGPRCCFVMLNPSTSDAIQDDPTVRRCLGFSKTWGFGSLIVLNIYPFRATDPKALLAAGDPVGGIKGDTVFRTLQADRVVVAWGALAPMHRHDHVLNLLRDHDLYCLGKTKDGFPRHPLYVAAATPLELFLEGQRESSLLRPSAGGGAQCFG